MVAEFGFVCDFVMLNLVWVGVACVIWFVNVVACVL